MQYMSLKTNAFCFNQTENRVKRRKQKIKQNKVYSHRSTTRGEANTFNVISNVVHGAYGQRQPATTSTTTTTNGDSSLHLGWLKLEALELLSEQTVWPMWHIFLRTFSHNLFIHRERFFFLDSFSPARRRHGYCFENAFAFCVLGVWVPY